MPQFTIKSLLFLAAVVAALALMAAKGVTTAGFVGCGVFVGLLFYKAAHDRFAANGDDPLATQAWHPLGMRVRSVGAQRRIQPSVGRI